MEQDKKKILSQSDENDNRDTVTGTNDLPDSSRDAERLKPDEGVLDLPEVSDIPGQEHVHVLPLGDLADTTASSEDEEGTALLGE